MRKPHTVRISELRVRGVHKISIPKRDRHTYIHTQNEIRSWISCLALRRSAIIRTYIDIGKDFHSNHGDMHTLMATATVTALIIHTYGGHKVIKTRETLIAL